MIYSFKNLPIRYKLFICYSTAFIVIIGTTTLFIYSMVRNLIESNIESELNNTTNTILNMVRTSAAVSIKNHIRAVSEKNLEIVEYWFNQYQSGNLSETEAKIQAQRILLSQKIGKSGYIYCINSQGTMKIHPKKQLIDVDISKNDFVRVQKTQKQGYIEYDWKNPGEKHKRPKALYMTWFEPWDWIISVSSYRKEFNALVNIDDFRDSILSVGFSKSGYSYVLDLEGNMIIHPHLEGKNYINSTDAGGRYFIKEMIEKKSGKIIYPWKNPDDRKSRDKLVIFNHIPEYGWIVASASYLDEIYAPLKNIRLLIMSGGIVSLFLALSISFRLGSSITNPIGQLMDKFSKGAEGDFSVRMKMAELDEVGELARYFNTFMQKLQAYEENLKQEIRERNQAEQALKLSQEMFSKAFNLSPNGICITTRKDMRFINVNDSFVKATGYNREEVIDKTFSELNILPEEFNAGIIAENLKNRNRIHNLEIEYITKEGNVHIGLLSSELIELWDEKCVLSTIEDVTDIKRLERQILKITEQERQKIGQDLHDDLGPHLIGIEVMGKVLQKKLENRAHEEIAYVSKIRELIKEAIEKTRRLARGLCPVHLVANGLESSLAELASHIEEVFDVPCSFDCQTPVILQDYTLATHIYYIVRESVFNAVKHAEAEQIFIDLMEKNGKIEIKIRDNGRGIPNAYETKGMGLNIMRFRARIIGAALNIETTDDGTDVTLSLRTESKTVISRESETRYSI